MNFKGPLFGFGPKLWVDKGSWGNGIFRKYGALEINFYHLWKFKKHKDPVLDQTNGFSALEKAANSGRKRKKRPSHEVKS